jgi:hypothetical protein
VKPDNAKMKFGTVAYTEVMVHICLSIKDKVYAIQMFFNPQIFYTQLMYHFTDHRNSTIAFCVASIV